MTITIAGVGIGDGNPCRFVAEISNNHNGDRDRCGRLIDAAKAAGADFVKFQCYTPDELVALRGDGPAPEPWGNQGWSMRDLYTKAQTPLDWFPKIAAHCERVGMPWFSSVFGPESLAVLEANGCPAYKIARLDNKNAELRNMVNRAYKPVIISATDGYDIHRVRTVPLTCWTGVGEVYLICPKGYPSNMADFRLSFHDFIGISSHCLDPLLPIAAVARGSHMVEMHFQLDDESSELESNVSLRASQFAQMIADVRRVEAMLA